MADRNRQPAADGAHRPPHLDHPTWTTRVDLPSGGVRKPGYRPELAPFGIGGFIDK